MFRYSSHLCAPCQSRGLEGCQLLLHFFYACCLLLDLLPSPFPLFQLSNTNAIVRFLVRARVHGLSRLFVDLNPIFFRELLEHLLKLIAGELYITSLELSLLSKHFLGVFQNVFRVPLCF